MLIPLHFRALAWGLYEPLYSDTILVMVTLYRRHSADCEATLKSAGKDPRTYTKCDCPIWATGHIAGRHQPRVSMRTRDWAEASMMALEAEAIGRGAVEKRHSIAQSTADFIAAKSTSRLAQGTINNVRQAAACFTRFCLEMKLVNLTDITPAMVEEYQRWVVAHGLAPSTGVTRVVLLGDMLSFCVRQGRLQTNPIDRAVLANAPRKMTEPLSDADVDKLIGYLDSKSTSKSKGRNQSDSSVISRPDLLRLLIRLMLYTGLRASDGLLFDPSKLTPFSDEAMAYTTIQTKLRHIGQEVDCFVSRQLAEEIGKCEWLGRIPFMRDGSDVRVSVVNLARKIRNIGKELGIKKCHPHRLRDTFAVRMLLKGVAIGDVSKLLGHASVVMTERYYAKWVPERRNRLGRVFLSAGGLDSGPA